MFTTKRIVAIISSLWMLSLLFGILGFVVEEYSVDPESVICEPKLRGLHFQLFGLLIMCMFNYLLYIHLNV